MGAALEHLFLVLTSSVSWWISLVPKWTGVISICHGTKQPERLEYLRDRPWIPGEQYTSGAPAVVAHNANHMA